jgi:hypothetical protein
MHRKQTVTSYSIAFVVDLLSSTAIANTPAPIALGFSANTCQNKSICDLPDGKPGNEPIYTPHHSNIYMIKYYDSVLHCTPIS